MGEMRIDLFHHGASGVEGVPQRLSELPGVVTVHHVTVLRASVSLTPLMIR